MNILFDIKFVFNYIYLLYFKGYLKVAAVADCDMSKKCEIESRIS